MDTNYYDVVVYGPDFTGLIAATLLGRRGLRVLLIGHDLYPLTFHAGPYLLHREPGMLPPPETEPVARILRELGLTQVIRRRVTSLKPRLQFHFRRPKQSFALPQDELDEDPTQENSQEKTNLMSVMNRVRALSAALDPLFGADITLPPVGFWERRDMGRILGQLSIQDRSELDLLLEDHPLKTGLFALCAFATRLSPVNLAPLVQGRAIDHAQRGVHQLPAGSDFRSLLQAKLATFSGETRNNVVPTELLFRRGVPSGLRIRPRDETIGFGRLLWAAPVQMLLALCGEEAPRALRDLGGTLRPACYRYTLSGLVRPESLPTEVGSRLIAIRDASKPISEDNALSITVGTPSPRQPDQVPLWVECLVPAHASESIGYLSVVRAHILQELGHILPSFHDHLLVLASPHDGLAPEFGPAAVVPAHLRAKAVAAYPLLPAFFCDEAQLMGFAAAAHSTGYKNLYLANGEILPGLGQEGEFVAAWGAARMVASPSPQRMRKRRQIVIEDV